MIGALLLTLGAFAPVQDTTPRELGRDEARVALDSALEWIVENQNEDGSWGLPLPAHTEDIGFAHFAYYGYREGAHGVVLRALLLAPSSPPAPPLRPSTPHKKRKSDQKTHHNAYKCNTAAAFAAPFVFKRASTPLLFVRSHLNRAYFNLHCEVRRGRGWDRASNGNVKQGYCVRLETCFR